MQLTDKELIKNIKRYSCSECIELLKNRHQGLIISIYNKYSGALKGLKFNINDFNDEINYIVYDAAKKFDLRKKNKYSSWLGDQVRYFCLNKITELNKKKYISGEPDDIIRIIDSCNNSEHSDDKRTKELCDYIFSILEQMNDKRIIKIFELRFFHGREYKNKLTWNEIGEIVGLSNQAVLNIFNKTIDLIRKKLKSENINDFV